MGQSQTTRRTILKGATVSSFALAAPAYLRRASAAGPIRIGIPTATTGGYAISGAQIVRTCATIQKMVDAKGGLLGQQVEFLFQDTQGDPAICVRRLRARGTRQLQNSERRH